MVRIASLAGLLALSAGACAAPGASSPETATQSRGECFHASRVSGFSDAGSNKAVVRIGSREMWELEISPGCPDVDWAMQLGIVSRGSQRICSGADAELLVPRASGSGFQRCLVRQIRKLSPEEAAARGLRPVSSGTP